MFSPSLLNHLFEKRNKKINKKQRKSLRRRDGATVVVSGCYRGADRKPGTLLSWRAREKMMNRWGVVVVVVGGGGGGVDGRVRGTIGQERRWGK